MNAHTLHLSPVTFKGQAGVRLTTVEGASAVVLLHGAHLVSWIPAGGVEQIYLSDRARFEPGQAIRGGVPVIFPQFERWGPDHQVPRHGLARTRAWCLRDPGGRVVNQTVSADFDLHEDEETLALWPHRFELGLTVSLSTQRLDLTLTVRHVGDREPLAFTAALHTYLRVRRIDEVAIRGLEGLALRDALAPASAENTGSDARSQGAGAQEGTVSTRRGPAELRIVGEFDQAFFDVPGPLQIREWDAAGQLRSDGLRLDLTQDGFADAVVWNPGPIKAAELSDLTPGGEQHFVCVEAAQVGRPVSLAPGATWQGRQTLSVATEPSSEGRP